MMNSFQGSHTLQTPTPMPSLFQEKYGQNPPPYQNVQDNQYIESRQGTMVQQPMAVQQAFPFPPNANVQQQQQIEQIIQNVPPEKLQLMQQQTQSMVASQQFAVQAPFQQQQHNMWQQPMQTISPQRAIQHSLPQEFQQTSQPHGNYTTTAPTGLFGRKQSGGHTPQVGPKDEKQTGGVQRFFGDTLVGRVARSSLQTATTTLKMPTSLSPWGDNNPVTLPNVRYRDAVLFTTFAFVGAPLVDGIADGITGAFGADSFISEIVSSGGAFITGNTIVKYGVFQIVEQAIDKGIIEHMLPEEEKMLQTNNVKSLQVGIKHKLMGVDADLRFVGTQPARSIQACEKGWFCPYLFASARTPSIPRATDFAICQFFGPALNGDYLMAHKLVSESAHAIAMCDADPQTDIGTNRMVILFTGISPFRTVWSTSRRPGCGTVIFHLPDGCPALIIPVTDKAPACAWSAWTLSQMRMAQTAAVPPTPGSGEYNAEWQHEQICEWLDTIISVPHVLPAIQNRYADVLGRAVSLVINGALALDRCQPLLAKLDPERAGIVMFRY